MKSLGAVPVNQLTGYMVPQMFAATEPEPVIEVNQDSFQGLEPGLSGEQRKFAMPCDTLSGVAGLASLPYLVPEVGAAPSC